MNQRFRLLKKQEQALMIASLAIVFPFYISVPIFLLAFAYLTYQERADLGTHLYKIRSYLIFIIFTGLVSLWRQNYMGVLVALAFLILALYFSIYHKWMRGDLVLKLIHLHVILSGFLATWAIYVYTAYVYQNGYDLLYIFKYNNLQTRAEASFFNANYYGLYIMFILALIYYLMVKIKSSKLRSLYGLIILLNIIAVILTASRWLWPTLLVAILGFIFFLNRSWVKYGFLVFLVVGLVLYLNPQVLPRAESLAYAFQDRLTLWETGFKLYQWHPWFGTGPMTFMSYYYLISDKGNMHAHNLLIDCLANYGHVGCLLLLFALGQSLKSLVPVIKDKKLVLESALILTFYLVLFFHGLMDVAILWIQTAYIFLMIVTLSKQTLEDLAGLKREDK